MTYNENCRMIKSLYPGAWRIDELKETLPARVPEKVSGKIRMWEFYPFKDKPKYLIIYFHESH